MPKCSFCGKSILKGTGKMFVRKDGRTYDYCSSKCEKNMLGLNRRSRTVVWTADARKAKEERAHAAKAEAPTKKKTAKKSGSKK